MFQQHKYDHGILRHSSCFGKFEVDDGEKEYWLKYGRTDWTILHICSYLRLWAHVKALTKIGADTTRKTSAGYTAKQLSKDRENTTWYMSGRESSFGSEVHQDRARRLSVHQSFVIFEIYFQKKN